MRKLVTVAIIVTALIATYTAQASTTKWTAKAAKQCPSAVKGVDFYKQATWKWQNYFGIKHQKTSHRTIASCKYGTWVAKLWRKRAWELRDLSRSYERANSDFNRASIIANQIFPTISTERLWNRADAEGGHGLWVWNRYGSGAGGWFQFMEGTYYGRSYEAFSVAHAKGFPVPSRYNSFYSMLGQNITAAYMFSIGLECAGEGWAASC